jgi:hypothetical protein
MKTADRENPNSRDRLRNVPSPWGGKQEAPSLNQAGWKVRKFPAEGEVFFLTFPFIELLRTWCRPPLTKLLKHNTRISRDQSSKWQQP